MQCLKKKSFYIRLNQWFKKLNYPNSSDKDLNDVTQSIEKIIFGQFLINGIPLSKNLQKYFHEMIKLLLLKISIFKKSILSEIGVPKYIWSPSGGGIFANIFRRVCKSNGSEVVGHEHGSGTGFLLIMEEQSQF